MTVQLLDINPIIQPTATILSAVIAGGIVIYGWFKTNSLTNERQEKININNNETQKLVKKTEEQYKYNNNVRASQTHFTGAATKLNEVQFHNKNFFQIPTIFQQKRNSN